MPGIHENMISQTDTIFKLPNFTNTNQGRILMQVFGLYSGCAGWWASPRAFSRRAPVISDWLREVWISQYSSVAWKWNWLRGLPKAGDFLESLRRREATAKSRYTTYWQDRPGRRREMAGSEQFQPAHRGCAERSSRDSPALHLSDFLYGFPGAVDHRNPCRR